ncbi:MAG: hypothetical protein R3E95_23955 [Thiolinea sp.]
MQAITTQGALRPQPAQLRLPAFPIGHIPTVPATLRDKTTKLSSSLSDALFNSASIEFFQAGNSIMCLKDSAPIAWIYPGHAGSRNNPGRCQFYDVAHPTLTTGEQGRITGIMLASESFETLPEAIQHIEATFGTGQGGAV